MEIAIFEIAEAQGREVSQVIIQILPGYLASLAWQSVAGSLNIAGAQVEEIHIGAATLLISGGDPGGANGPHMIDQAADKLAGNIGRSEEHTSELQSRPHLVCRLL